MSYSIYVPSSVYSYMMFERVISLLPLNILLGCKNVSSDFFLHLIPLHAQIIEENFIE